MFEIKKSYIATGYAESSGIELIRTELFDLLKSGGDLRLIIGSLKSYNSGEQIKKMNTTMLLGVLIHDRNLSPKIKVLIENELKERGALV
jgi:hypothetical protein